VAALFAGIPCITHERGINERFSNRSRMLARTLRAVICISAAVRENLVSSGLDTLRLVTIHNGLDPASMCARRSAAQVRVELGLSPEQRLIGVIGNIKPWKGQEVVVRAMGLLKDRYTDLTCVLVGDTAQAERDYLRRIESIAADLGVSERILITGYRSDVADFVAALDIQVHASIAPEPFGRVLLEGMAFAKPLVASGGGAVPEIVADGETGLLFRPGVPEDLARCLQRLLDDSELAARMGREGYARLQTSFSITANVRQTEDLYCRLLGGAKPVARPPV
jgi:glycosyltransferase involved in cell wall biosynthesis